MKVTLVTETKFWSLNYGPGWLMGRGPHWRHIFKGGGCE